MGTGRRTTTSWVLLTGATGFVGQCLLGELLDRRYRVLAMVRASAPGDARERLQRAMEPWSRDLEAAFESGQLAVLRGDLRAADGGVSHKIRRHLRGSVAALVHAAGCTSFRQSADGEPMVTNVDGTANACRFAERCGCPDWHLISTAYVCGKVESASEVPLPDPPDSRNVYEHSKWLAESRTTQAAAQAGAALTIHRPAIVVGHSHSGVATRFAGMYYLFRATSLVAQAVAHSPDLDRHRIALRICADPDSAANLMCANDLARDFGDLFDRPESRGGVYHLTHPAPPSNLMVKRALERYYGIGGGRFVGAGTALPVNNRSVFEAVFADITRGISPYVFDAPRFDRRQTARFTTRPPVLWTEARLHRLLRYAEAVGWRPGRPERSAEPPGAGLDAYFERFLPVRVLQSTISRIGRLDLDVRFRIDSSVDGDWWCRFRHGKVVDVHRRASHQAQVTFRTTPSAFWRAVAGEVSGAELFLSGAAHIEGDIERGLKFAMILDQFVREFPYLREGQVGHELRTL